METDTTKERSFQRLVGNLEEMTKLYRQLLDLVRKEKQLLIEADMEKLHENNETKENLLFKIKSIDGLRMRYAAELASLVHADSENPRLLDIAKNLATGATTYTPVLLLQKNAYQDKMNLLPVETAEGPDELYWEHWGKLGDPVYDESVRLRRDWYQTHGYAAKLIETNERGGFDSKKIEKVIRDRILS